MATDFAVGESMILEEDIDENYEPTEQEIIEYAKFLGMDTDKERDLFWIAREGLKAPLPNPWKPCQTKEGEIYYFNFQSGESQWEHPCDEYYKKMYDKEKKKKQQERVTGGAKKETQNSTAKAQTKAPIKAQLPIQETSPAPLSTGGSKLPLKKKDTMAYMEINKKANDPLLKAQQEKKLNNYKEQKEQELKARKQNIEKEFEDKKKSLENEHKRALEALEKKYQEMKRTEEAKLKEEYKPIDERDIPREKLKYAEEVREELERELKEKLDVHKESLELELNNVRNEYQNKKKEKVRELTEKIGARYKQTIEDLEVDVSKLRAVALSEKMQQDDSGSKAIDSMKKAFMNEQETKFQLEKENLKKQINQQTRALKLEEDQKYQNQVNELYKEFERDTKDKESFDEERYKTSLEIDLRTKLEQYKTQVNRKFEIMKLNSLEKLKDYERQKLEAFRAGMGGELEYLEEDFNKQKADLEAKFQKDKVRAEQKIEEDIANYRELSMKKLEEKKRLLDNEKFEKLNMLRIKLSTLKGVDQEDLKSTEKKLSQMEDQIRSFQATLDEKQEVYRKEAALKDKLLAEINTLEGGVTGSPSAQKPNELDYETRQKIEQLNKILKEKNQQIEILKNEKSKGDRFTSSAAIPTDMYEGQNMAGEVEAESFEIDRIHLDLEDIKKFIKANMTKDESEFRDDRHESDADFRNQYRHYQLPASKESNVKDLSMELTRDRKTLEKKKAQLLRDLEMVNNDREMHRGDREKQEFLRDVKKLIQNKLGRVNSQLEYLIKLSGKMERSASIDKVYGQKPYLIRYQNDSIEDTNSEAFSEDVDMS